MIGLLALFTYSTPFLILSNNFLFYIVANNSTFGLREIIINSVEPYGSLKKTDVHYERRLELSMHSSSYPQTYFFLYKECAKRLGFY